MPSFPIIDTHLHVWDPARISYSWQKCNALFERTYRVEEYRQASAGIDVEAMVFIECHIDDAPGVGRYIIIGERAR